MYINTTKTPTKRFDCGMSSQKQEKFPTYSIYLVRNLQQTKYITLFNTHVQYLHVYINFIWIFKSKGRLYIFSFYFHSSFLFDFVFQHFCKCKKEINVHFFYYSLFPCQILPPHLTFYFHLFPNRFIFSKMHLVLSSI